MEAKIVVGSNYGDECKGLVTHYLCNKYKDKKVLNILYNGGSQRGHTVDYGVNLRHVYHHLGSGTVDGADTYFHKDFILNPLNFNSELLDINAKFKVTPTIYASGKCRVTTPFDMILNQMVEDNRGVDKHGSCGMGIFETILRYENSTYNWTLEKMINSSDRELKAYLEEIARFYTFTEVQKRHIKDEVVNKFLYFLTSNIAIENWIDDFRFMATQLKLTDSKSLYQNYDVMVFEAGQGLALDKDNKEDFPHLTPSNTGAKVPMNEIKNYVYNSCSVEIFYVTRTYFTRHGAGPLPTECKREDISNCIEDKTNVPNPYQDSIRYGHFNKTQLLNRIKKDIETFPCDVSFTTTLAITHNNFKELDTTSLLNNKKVIFNSIIKIGKFGEVIE